MNGHQVRREHRDREKRYCRGWWCVVCVGIIYMSPTERRHATAVLKKTSGCKDQNVSPSWLRLWMSWSLMPFLMPFVQHNWMHSMQCLQTKQPSITVCSSIGKNVSNGHGTPH